MTTDTANTILVIIALTIATVNCLWTATRITANYLYTWITFYFSSRPSLVPYIISISLVISPMFGLVLFQWGLISHLLFTLTCLELYLIITVVNVFIHTGGIPNVIKIASAYLSTQLAPVLLIFGSLLYRVLYVVLVTHFR